MTKIEIILSFSFIFLIFLFFLLSAITTTKKQRKEHKDWMDTKKEREKIFKYIDVYHNAHKQKCISSLMERLNLNSRGELMNIVETLRMDFSQFIRCETHVLFLEQYCGGASVTELNKSDLQKILLILKKRYGELE